MEFKPVFSRYYIKNGIYTDWIIRVSRIMQRTATVSVHQIFKRVFVTNVICDWIIRLIENKIFGKWMLSFLNFSKLVMVEGLDADPSFCTL